MNRMSVFALVGALSLIITSTAQAVPEDGYAQSYETLVQPWADTGVVSSFNGERGIDISYITFEAPGANDAIVILNGRTENYLKYLEAAYDLRGLGASIYLMDHRGQGSSERILSDRQKGYVKHFDNYVKDLKKLVKDIVRPAGYSRVFVLGHSMGGAVATRFAQQYPHLVDALILSAPMLQINTSPYPESIAYAAAQTLTWFWQGESYAPGRGPYYTETFEEQSLTQSEARYAMGEAKLAANPALRLGGPTNRWLAESIWATWKAGWDAKKLTMPVILFQASNDQIVNPGRQTSICADAVNCQLVTLAGAEHELLVETDSVRDIVLDHIHTFVNSNR